MKAAPSAQGAPPENETAGVERAGRVETQKQRHFATPTAGKQGALTARRKLVAGGRHG